MSAKVETMAYTNEVPWHGLGTKIDEAQSVDEMLVTAGLDWTVDKRALTTMGNDGDELKVPGHFALVRSSDDKVLDVVGNVYQPVQNAEAFEFFQEFVEAGDATMETAGSLAGGTYVWGLAKLDRNFTLPGKDKVLGYLLVVCPHQQGKSLIYKPTTVRTVCWNTLSMALRENSQEFRHAHRVEFTDETIREAKTVLGLAREQVGEFEATARRLKKFKVTDEMLCELLTPVINPKADVEALLKDHELELPRRMVQVMDCYRNAPGADPGTGWGALNAVTYWADHVASRTRDSRMKNAWLGRTARMKEKAMAVLVEAAQ